MLEQRRQYVLPHELTAEVPGCYALHVVVLNEGEIDLAGLPRRIRLSPDLDREGRSALPLDFRDASWNHGEWEALGEDRLRVYLAMEDGLLGAAMDLRRTKPGCWWGLAKEVTDVQVSSEPERGTARILLTKMACP